MAEEKAVAFSKPDQILEILKETEKLNLDVHLRYAMDGKIIRGMMHKVFLSPKENILISNISSLGKELLQKYQMIRLEFVLLSKKVYFISKVEKWSEQGILLQFPSKIVVLERRQNARFVLPSDFSSLVFFEKIYWPQGRWDTPPCLENDKSKHEINLNINDISIGGFGVLTNFKGITDVLSNEMSPFYVSFQFPGIDMQRALVSVRWVKTVYIKISPQSHVKMRELILKKTGILGVSSDKLELQETQVRVGFQFCEISSDLDKIVRLFMRKIQSAGTI